MAVEFTRKQEQVIRRAWDLIMAAVDSSNQQERRLKACLRASMKHFGPVFGRFHLIREVFEGASGLATPEVLSEKSHEDEERILAYMVGCWIRARGRFDLDLKLAINDAFDAYLAAQVIR